ncbi:MAG TPA: 50S ribosomal protein L9 [Syntrophales bacterium]|jgi:large subunit ribosomal protein L9|nr:50S ribosomal protein L9 [Syntrophales bacterium]HOU76989.1 50S ribosomal protein L9 [Syntrophales bacterium]HPC32269.1 50S ribosomal protein L9 [Syntrophales bacterium]HQG34011.1 50S ribosomal protein L9 [Syntrophales bacterium]HQI35386.1 50S ribosomal protein L9 [Syntrophales bacterium]
MKVILKQNVDDLGKIGDVLNVSDGYARNYLIPKGLAAEATSRSIHSLEHERKRILQKAEKEKQRAAALLEKIAGVTCIIPRRVGEQDKLFGSVNNKDIEKALEEMGLEIDRKAIVMAEPIKTLGEFPVRIKLPAGLAAEIKIQVVKEG